MGAVNMYVGSLNTAITLNFRLDRIGQVQDRSTIADECNLLPLFDF
jgi:hypothetical protein